MQGGAGPDDVGDRVPRPHLVELDLLDRYAVYRRLDLGEAPEDRRGAVGHRFGQSGRLDATADVPPAPVRMVLDDGPDLDLHGAHAGALYLGTVSCTVSGSTRSTSRCTSASSAPASTSAPSSMSPATPAVTSSHAITPATGIRLTLAPHSDGDRGQVCTPANPGETRLQG